MPSSATMIVVKLSSRSFGYGNKMTAVITDMTQLTPAWLTDVLCANGHLERGRVTHVKVSSPGETINAKYAYLLLRYSDDAVANAPPHPHGGRPPPY